MKRVGIVFDDDELVLKAKMKVLQENKTMKDYIIGLVRADLQMGKDLEIKKE